MKKIISLVMTTLIIFTLAACGSFNPAQGSAASVSTPASAPDSTEKFTSGNGASAENALPPEDDVNSGTNTASNKSLTPVRITLSVGNTMATAELNDSELARQFAALLPQIISMSRVREREYYGRIDDTLSYDEGNIQTTAEDGDLAYWFSGNSLAFFFNTENDSAVNSGIVVFGKITSNLSVFNNMGSSEIITVTLAE